MKNNTLYKGISRGLVALLLLFSLSVNAQSLTGTRGLIKAPTARMYESGTLAFGIGYVPAKFFKRTYGKFKGLRTGSPGLNTFITANPLPFMEIMFRYSHELNNEVSMATKYFPDRMFTARFKLLEEKKYNPAFLIGMQDISSITNSTSRTGSNFIANYIVGSKTFNFEKISIDLSIGHTINLFNLPSKDFKGLFGGIEIKYNDFDKAQLIIDYDTTSYNIGLQGLLFNRIHTVLGLMDFEPMFIIAYRYKI